MKFIKIILNLMATRAGRKRWCLEVGSYLLKKGVGAQIGDPVQRWAKGKQKTYYVANLHYDFGHNRINHTLTNKKPQVEKAG